LGARQLPDTGRLADHVAACVATEVGVTSVVEASGGADAAALPDVSALLHAGLDAMAPMVVDGALIQLARTIAHAGAISHGAQVLETGYLADTARFANLVLVVCAREIPTAGILPHRGPVVPARAAADAGRLPDVP
jgi:hypothetical protein